MLFGLCVAGVILGNLQNGAKTSHRIDPSALVVRYFVTPLASPISRVTDAVSEFTGGIFAARSLSAQNRILKAQQATFALYAEQIESRDREVERLRTLLGFNAVPGKKKVPGSVIGLSINENRLTLDVGSNQGIRAGCPVESADGLVGTVEEVEKNECQVLMLTSAGLQSNAQGKPLLIGAIDVNRNPPPVGLLRGENASTLSLTFLDPKAPAQIGDVITTSGYSDKIPRGLMIGKIIQIEPNEEFGTLRARVDPAFSAGNLDVVFVLV